MNKELWNTVILDGRIEFSMISKIIPDSYTLVGSKLIKAERQALLTLLKRI
jgi:predicted DNA-binding protein (MmcQ/YjbR family)